MDQRSKVWVWRARRVDATWREGIPTDGDDRVRQPEAFRRIVAEVARPVLRSLARDEVTIRGLRSGERIDADALAADVLARTLPGLDPGDGVRLAVVKLQLAVLEAIDEALAHDLLDDEEAWDREWTDERGLVDFL